MNSRDNILNELRGISPAVASIPSSLPYQQVPEGYFDQLPALMLQLVKDDERSAILESVGTAFPYQAPAGYFDGLADAILQRVKSTDAGSVDDELSELSPLLSGLKKKTPFHVPKGYFEDLSGNAVAGAKAIEFVNEELENLSPLMESLKDKQVYEIPQGYFDELPASLLTLVKQPAQKAKVVSIGSTRRVMRYLAAAAITGLVVMAGLLFLNKKPEIINKPDVASIDLIKKDVQKLSDNEIQSFIENMNTAVIETSNPAEEEITADDVRDLLADVSDDELLQYLGDHPGAIKSNDN